MKSDNQEPEVKYEDREERWQMELVDTVKLELIGAVFGSLTAE